MLHYPALNPIAFSLGPIQVHWYGLMYLVGFAAAVGFAAGRLGNFINNELWGKPSTVPWGFAVPQCDGSALVLHASRLYEAALEGIV